MKPLPWIPGAGVALLALLVPGCHARPRHVAERPDPPADVAAAGSTDGGIPGASPGVSPGVSPAGVVGELNGVVNLDAVARLRQARPSPGAGLAGPAVTAAGLYPGDVLATGPRAGAEVRFRPEGSLVLGPEGVLEVPGYAGAAAVLERGVAEVTSPGAAVRVDTPAGRVIVSSGRCAVAVADDGAVALWAEAGAVTVWPSPAAPGPRSTQLSRAEVARRLRARQGHHPILLDVDLADVAAQAVRPVASRAVATGEVLAWDALGTPDGHPPAAGVPGAPRAASRAAIERWVAVRAAAVARPGGHHPAITDLARAGAGDLADVRAAVARLRAAGAARTPQARATLLGQLSLALGRATARARRGRDLAGRGGDVTALVQLAALEDLRDASWAVAPLDDR